VGSLARAHCYLNIVIFVTPEYSRHLLKPGESPGSCEKLLEKPDWACLHLLIQRFNARRLRMIQPLSVADSCRTKNRTRCTVYKGPLLQQKNASHLPLSLQLLALSKISGQLLFSSLFVCQDFVSTVVKP
jgi:hypothetical protein